MRSFSAIRAKEYGTPRTALLERVKFEP